MKSDYLAIFEKRGQSYDRAMQHYPAARDAEFHRLLEHIDTAAMTCILDVPSGGGYLAKFFPPAADIHSVEPCREFTPKVPHLTSDIDLDTLSLPGATYDLVVCQAAIHHVKNKARFFAQCHDALKPGGLFCIGDIRRDHRIARFLDGFAGAHNGTGHHGYYLTEADIHTLAAGSRFTVLEIAEKDCPWEFASIAAMLDFCRLLFGLTVDDATLRQALDTHIGTSEHRGRFRLHWQMLYATLQKV